MNQNQSTIQFTIYIRNIYHPPQKKKKINSCKFISMYTFKVSLQAVKHHRKIMLWKILLTNTKAAINICFRKHHKILKHIINFNLMESVYYDFYFLSLIKSWLFIHYQVPKNMNSCGSFREFLWIEVYIPICTNKFGSIWYAVRFWLVMKL